MIKLATQITVIFMAVIFFNTAQSSTVPPLHYQDAEVFCSRGHNNNVAPTLCEFSDLGSAFQDGCSRNGQHYQQSLVNGMPDGTTATYSCQNLTQTNENSWTGDTNVERQRPDQTNPENFYFDVFVTRTFQDLKKCPPDYPVILDTDQNGQPSLCGEIFDYCKTLPNQDMGTFNESSFCYSTQTPQGQAANCNMLLINNGVYQATGESCTCNRDTLSEFGSQKCFNDEDLGNQPQDPENEPTEDDSPDPDPNPEDDDGDGDNSDELDEARNELLLEIENNTDELEQKNEKSNEFLEAIMKKLGITNSTLDAILKKEIPVSGGGTGGEDGDGQDPEEEDKCPSGQFLIGEDCVTFDAGIPPEDSKTGGEWNDSSLESDKQEAKTEFEQKFNQITQEINAIFTDVSMSGSCQSNQQQIKGRTVDLSACDKLSQFNVGVIILLVAAIVSLAIILGRSK